MCISSWHCFQRELLVEHPNRGSRPLTEEAAVFWWQSCHDRSNGHWEKGSGHCEGLHHLTRHTFDTEEQGEHRESSWPRSICTVWKTEGTAVQGGGEGDSHILYQHKDKSIPGCGAVLKQKTKGLCMHPQFWWWLQSQQQSKERQIFLGRLLVEKAPLSTDKRRQCGSLVMCQTPSPGTNSTMYAMRSSKCSQTECLTWKVAIVMEGNQANSAWLWHCVWTWKAARNMCCLSLEKAWAYVALRGIQGFLSSTLPTARLG